MWIMTITIWGEVMFLECGHSAGAVLTAASNMINKFDDVQTTCNTIEKYLSEQKVFTEKFVYEFKRVRPLL